jgi:hypothetical protein
MLPSNHSPARDPRWQKGSCTASNQDSVSREPIAASRESPPHPNPGRTTLPMMPRSHLEAAAVKLVARTTLVPAHRLRKHYRPSMCESKVFSRVLHPPRLAPRPGARVPKWVAAAASSGQAAGGGGGLEAVAGSARAAKAGPWSPGSRGR